MIKTRRKLIFFFSLLLSVSLIASPASANGPGVCGPENFAGGDGTEGNPYQIYDQNSLSELRDCGDTYHYYVLNNNVTLTSLWQPITYFTGSLNGNGYGISGIEIIQFANYVGLFGTIENSNITDLALSGEVTNYGLGTGLLAGLVNNSSISNISAYSDIHGYVVTGGVVGSSTNTDFYGIAVAPFELNSQITVNGWYAGGVVGRLENGDADFIWSNIEVVGLDGASYLGGIAGKTLWSDGPKYTHSNLTAEASIWSLDNGAMRCGGIVGDGDFSMTSVTVTSPYIECESHDVGGVAGYFIASLSTCKVESHVEVAPVDGQQGGWEEAGGIIGWWQGGLDGMWSIDNCSFSGEVVAETNTGGIAGVITVDNSNETASYSIQRVYVNATLKNSRFAGGLLGYMNKDGDNLHSNDPTLSITQAYSNVDFENIEEFSDSVMLVHPEFTTTFNAVAWNSSASNSATEAENVTSANLRTMQTPGFWETKMQWDVDTVWGMSSETNNGLPILRTLYSDVTYDVECEAESAPDIRFAKNSAKLSRNAKISLSLFSSSVKNTYCTYVYVNGFASGKEIKAGRKKTVWQKNLSTLRKNAVKKYLNQLFSENEVKINISSAAFGAKQKKNSDKTAKQQAANRRVEIGTTS